MALENHPIYNCTFPLSSWPKCLKAFHVSAIVRSTGPTSSMLWYRYQTISLVDQKTSCRSENLKGWDSETKERTRLDVHEKQEKGKEQTRQRGRSSYRNGRTRRDVLSAENPPGKLFLRWLANRREPKLRSAHKATVPLYRTKGIRTRDREGSQKLDVFQLDSFFLIILLPFFSFFFFVFFTWPLVACATYTSVLKY